jgi:hypothetical protein
MFGFRAPFGSLESKHLSLLGLMEIGDGIEWNENKAETNEKSKHPDSGIARYRC